MSKSNIMDELETFKKEYYDNTSKNLIFKNNQKIECAEKISSQFQVEVLIEKTIYLLPNTNKIYMDYTLFKLYAHPQIYETVVNYVLNLFHYCIEHYHGFDVHLNMKSLTVSEIHRYKDVIELFYKKTENTTLYTKNLNCMYIYHTPSTINELVKIILTPPVIPKLKMFSKGESDEKIKALLGT